MNQIRSLSVIAALAALAAVTVSAQPKGLREVPESAVNEVVERHMKELGIVGLTLGISIEGKPVLVRSWGYSNVEVSTKTEHDSVYEIASLTKQFTASVIHLLAEQGKLSLDDSLRKWLPAGPKEWDPITLRHMISHQSGLVNSSETPEFRRLMRMPTQEMKFLQLMRDKPVLFEPGERYHYSNTNFHLLSIVAQRASGKSFEELLETLIFEPAGMTRTQLNDPDKIVPNRTRGYRRVDGKLENAAIMGAGWSRGSGELLSTVPDLLKWDAALRSGAVLSEKITKQAWRPEPLRDGGKTSYGHGWSITEREGRTYIKHNGSRPGFTAHYSMVKEPAISIVVMMNTYQGRAEQLAWEVLDLYFAPAEESARAPSATNRS
ncbi:MAG: serine hydrolase domain-containing protein [Fimbriimonadaceae bacterium]